MACFRVVQPLQSISFFRFYELYHISIYLLFCIPLCSISWLAPRHFTGPHLTQFLPSILFVFCLDFVYFILCIVTTDYALFIYNYVVVLELMVE